MTGIQSPRDLRRSSRITISIPVEVLGQDTDGEKIRAAATTKYVNRHGALLLAERAFPLDTEVTVQIPHLEREQQCRVVWVSTERDENGRSGLGIQLEQAENFWGVQFPPDDWVAQPQAPLAGEFSGPTLSASESDENERRTIRTMLNALVSVLEEKGFLTRAELADMFQRQSRAEAAVRSQSESRTITRGEPS